MKCFLVLFAGLLLVGISRSDRNSPAHFIKFQENSSNVTENIDELIFAHVVSDYFIFCIFPSRFFFIEAMHFTALSSRSTKHSENISE